MINHKKTQVLMEPIILPICIFFILYNISFQGIESVTTGRIVIIIAALWAWMTGKSIVNLLRDKIWLLIIPLPYVLIQYIYVGDIGQLSRFINLVIISYFGAALIVIISPEIKTLLKSILIAITVQSIIIIISFFDFNYRVWFDTVVFSGMNYGSDYLYRAPGFSSTSGAALSVIQSLGVLVGWVLLKSNKFFIKITEKWVYLTILSMFISGVSCVFVGRTGLLLSVLYMVLLAISFEFRKKLFGFFVSITSIAYFVFTVHLIPLLGQDFSIEYFENWVFGFFIGKDDTIKAITEMPVPPLTVETFIGTGLSSPIAGSNPSGHDSGFIQAYYSMGLPVTIIFYCIYIYVLWHLMRWLPRTYKLILVMVFFLIEVKEPFLFKYSGMFVLMVMYFSHKMASENQYRDLVAELK